MAELRFYNTLTRKVEPFAPQPPGPVRMYHCGPTVYQRPHVGNYRAFLFADLLRRWLEQCGYKVLQVMNLTDVGHLLGDGDQGEDRMEKQARQERIDPWELTRRVSAQFFTDLEALQVRKAHHYPRATEHIPEMVDMVRALLQKGHAYRVGDNVYFDVATYPRYGQLSGNRVADLEAGARLELNPEKRHPADFALWKSDPAHIMQWDTEFGRHGFPGWHIECSAMARKYLGDSFDVHTGGEDNVFPHHECEIAQSECANGRPFVGLWMHTKFLMVDGGKMSKSLGNVYLLDDVVARGFSPLDLRFFLLRAHYRGSLNFTWAALQGAAEARKSLQDFRGRLLAEFDQIVRYTPGDFGPVVKRARAAFHASMADDLNVSAALAAVFELRNTYLRGQLERAELRSAEMFLSEVNDLFVFLEDEQSFPDFTSEQVESLLQERAQARQRKDFQKSDEIRRRLASAGIVIEDGPQGTRWHRSV